MKTSKVVYKTLSKCCNEKVGFVPPCFGDPEIIVCFGCNTMLNRDDITTTKEEIVTHIEIQKGIFRLIENC